MASDLRFFRVLSSVSSAVTRRNGIFLYPVPRRLFLLRLECVFELSHVFGSRETALFCIQADQVSELKHLIKEPRDAVINTLKEDIRVTCTCKLNQKYDFLSLRFSELEASVLLIERNHLHPKLIIRLLCTAIN